MIARIGAGTEDDLEDVARVESAAEIAPIWTPELLRTELERDVSRLLVAHEGRALAGFVLYTVAADEADVTQLAVDPHFQRRGIGRALMDAAMAEAAESGATVMFLDVRQSNEPAQRLYEGAGFEIVGKRLAYYGDGEDALLMKRALGGPNSPL